MTTDVRRRWKYSVLLVGLVALGWVVWEAFLYAALVRGRIWKEDLGGQWVIEYQDSPLSHSGPQATLLRRDGRKTVVVDELIQDARFYGEDCIVYSTSRGSSGVQYLGVCGAKMPALLISPTFDDWALREDGLRRNRVVGGGRSPTREISIAEIKERARRQPPLREKWFEQSLP